MSQISQRQAAATSRQRPLAQAAGCKKKTKKKTPSSHQTLEIFTAYTSAYERMKDEGGLLKDERLCVSRGALIRLLLLRSRPRTGSCSSQATSSCNTALEQSREEEQAEILLLQHRFADKCANCKQASEGPASPRQKGRVIMWLSVCVCVCVCARRIPWRPVPSAASPSWSVSCGPQGRPTTPTASPAWCATAAWTACPSPWTRPTKSTASRTSTSPWSLFQLSSHISVLISSVLQKNISEVEKTLKAVACFQPAGSVKKSQKKKKINCICSYYPGYLLGQSGLNA